MANLIKRISSKKIRRPSKTENLLFEIQCVDESNYNRVNNFVNSMITWLKENKGNQTKNILKGEANPKLVGDLVRLVEKQAILNHYEIPKDTDPHLVAVLLRDFFRLLKEPIIPYSIYSSFIAANSHQNPEKKAKYLQSALSLLPRNHLFLLKNLCQYLNELGSQHGTTGTTVEDLAIAFGPSLLRPKAETRLLMITDAEHIAGVIALFIEQVDFIFTVDKQPKSKEAFQTKMQKVYSSNALASFQELSSIKESENIDNKTFRSTLESIGDQLNNGDSKTLQMLIDKKGENSSLIAVQKKKSSSNQSRLGTTGGALRIQMAKMKIAQDQQAATSDPNDTNKEPKEPMIMRTGPENYLNLERTDTEVLIADEMAMIMKQIYGEEEVKETKIEEDQMHEMRNILKNIYCS